MLTKRYYKTKNEVDVTFQYDGEANEVDLVCEINNWEPVAMTRNQGAYKRKMRLPGNSRFQYRYLVNKSDWVTDPGADAQWPNEYGETNSVVDTTMEE